MFKQYKIYKIILFRPEIYEFFLSFFQIDLAADALHTEGTVGRGLIV